MSTPTDTKNTPTAARVFASNSAHWYRPETAEACYQLPKADGKGLKVPTLADARKLNLCPSVTTILDAVLRKPALEAWKTEQAVLACLTAPRKEGEALDAFIKRVLQEEQQQNQEAKAAADMGTKIHEALELYFTGDLVPDAMKEWIMPAANSILTYGAMAATEKILVGDGYAGKTDLIQDCPECWRLWDWKSTKKLPDPTKGGAWTEHRLQLSAYAAAYEELLQASGDVDKPIRTGNVYISSVEKGSFVVCEHENWSDTFEEGFAPLVKHWQWSNRYRPAQNRPAPALTKLPEPLSPPQSTPPAPAAAQPVTRGTAGKNVVWTPGIPTK